jgi:hypothetical protein
MSKHYKSKKKKKKKKNEKTKKRKNEPDGAFIFLFLEFITAEISRWIALFPKNKSGRSQDKKCSKLHNT